MSKVWIFEPGERKKGKYRRPRGIPNLAWVAPEHARIAASMEADYPRDDFGYPVPEKKKELVLDKRPLILVPPRPTINPF